MGADHGNAGFLHELEISLDFRILQLPGAPLAVGFFENLNDITGGVAGAFDSGVHAALD